MTEKLKTLLHERADAPVFSPVDLDTLVRAGDRRIHRRRAGLAAGSLAVLAVVGGLLVPRLGGSGPDATPVVTDPASSQRHVSWATDSVIHDGDRTIDVGISVHAYVRTSTGYVFADPEGVVHSVVDGQVSEVGRTDAELPRLVADQEDSLAGWVEGDGARPAFLVLDQATGQTVRNEDATAAGMGGLADEKDPAYFYAIDDGVAYWRDQRGAVAVDLDSGEVRVIDADAINGFDILDAEDGLIAFNANEDGTALGRTRDDAVMLPQVYGSMGVFSPGARYYSSDADEPEVYDARTGRRIEFELDGRTFATGYEWLDDDTLAMIAAKGPKAPVELLSCEVPEGSCTPVVADLGTFAEITGHFQLPVGETVGD